MVHKFIPLLDFLSAVLTFLLLLVLAIVVYIKWSNDIKNFILKYMKSKKWTFGTDNLVKESVEVVPSIAAVGTATNKNDRPNQDACSCLFVEPASAYIVAVADGVGSHPHAGAGSAYVVKKALELLAKAVTENAADIDFDALFSEIQDGLNDYVDKHFPNESELKPGGCFGTTLIVGIDFPDRFVTAYVGNGGMFNISGYFAGFSSNIYLPWNAINMLNPHTVEQEGRESLYRIFTWKGDKLDCRPSVFEIRKNKNFPGEIFVLTTDGVFSNDHLIAGKDGEGTIWIPSSRPVEILFDHLKKFMLNSGITHDGVSLEKMLKVYLETLKTEKEMFDDTSLGVIISGNSLEYFEQKRNSIVK
jgi:serine/threonine protein phosphatase PrpC